MPPFSRTPRRERDRGHRPRHVHRRTKHPRHGQRGGKSLEARIAAEHFVTADARQHGLDAARGHRARHVVGVHGVSRRLIEVLDDGRQVVRNPCRIDAQHVMGRPEHARHALRIGSFGVLGFVDDHREGPKIGGGHLACGGHDGARVDASRQEHADRNIGDKVRADGLANGGSRGVAQGRFVRVNVSVDVGVCRIGERTRRPLAVAGITAPGGGLQRLDVIEPRQRRRNACPVQIRQHAGGADRSRHEASAAQRAHLGRKRDTPGR
jgi:hypothetical protein